MGITRWSILKSDWLYSLQLKIEKLYIVRKLDLKLNIQNTKVMASGPIISWQTEGEKVETVTDFLFLGLNISADGDCVQETRRWLLHSRKGMTNLASVLKIKDISLPAKVCIVTAMVFPSSHLWLWVWTIKKVEYQRIDLFELWCWRRLLKCSLDNKEIKPVTLKGNQPWIFTGMTDADAEAPIFWSPDANTQLIGKDPDDGKDWG